MFKKALLHEGKNIIKRCFYNNVGHSLMKWLSFCSSFNALSTDTSCVKLEFAIVVTGILDTMFSIIIVGSVNEFISFLDFLQRAWK